MGRIRKFRLRKRLIILLLALLLLMAAAAVVIKIRIEPNLEEVGQMRAQIMVSQIVNKALNQQMYDRTGMKDLLIRQTGDDGQMQVIQANTQAMNLLMTEISLELQQQYAARPEDVYEVPLGTLLGDKVLSQTNPKVPIRIIPISVSSMDYKTEFETAGINQTKYKVYLEMESHVKVIAPLVEETFSVSTIVPVAEAVILGAVPDSYVHVPEEDILDVTNE